MPELWNSSTSLIYRLLHFDRSGTAVPLFKNEHYYRVLIHCLNVLIVKLFTRMCYRYCLINICEHSSPKYTAGLGILQLYRGCSTSATWHTTYHRQTNVNICTTELITFHTCSTRENFDSCTTKYTRNTAARCRSLQYRAALWHYYGGSEFKISDRAKKILEYSGPISVPA